MVIQYHLRCMSKFRNKRPKGVEDLSVAESDFQSEHNKVFQMLVSEISPGLLLEKHACRMDQLKDRYRMLLLEQGVITKKPYRKDRLKKRLLNYFGDDIQAITLTGRGSLLCASSLTMKEPCDEVVSLQSQVDECQLTPADDLDDHAPSVSSNSYHLTKHLQAEIKKAENNTWKTVDEDEMGISYADAVSRVPVDLYNLAWLNNRQG